MRAELSNNNWHVYGLSTSDYDYTVTLLKDVIIDRQKQLEIKIKKLKKVDYDATDDLLYYTYIDNLFLLHFALWRLQGIFEGILQQDFFPNKKLFGLKVKLQFIRSIGLIIKDKDYNHLLKWGKLRNALSHFLPEQFRLSFFSEEDIEEYLEFVKRLTKDLQQQKEVITNKTQ